MVSQRHKCAVRVRIAHIDGLIAVQRTGGQDCLFFFCQQRAFAICHDGIKIGIGIGLTNRAGHAGIADNGVFTALGIVDPIDRIVVHLLGRRILCKRHAVTIGNAFLSLAVKARAIGERVSFRRIGDGIVNICRQGAAQLCRAALKMRVVINLRPFRQRVRFQPGRCDGCQYICLAHAVGQRDLAGLCAENRQSRGICSRARHLQLHGHVHVPHTHVVLNDCGVNRQICLNRQRAHICQCRRKRINQCIQLLILRRGDAGFD